MKNTKIVAFVVMVVVLLYVPLATAKSSTIKGSSNTTKTSVKSTSKINITMPKSIVPVVPNKITLNTTKISAKPTSLKINVTMPKSTVSVVPIVASKKAAAVPNNVATKKTTSTSQAGGYFYTHNEKNVMVKGDKNLYYGKIGETTHNHAVIDSKGIPQYIRENGKVIVEDTRTVGRAVVNGGKVAVKKAAPYVSQGAAASTEVLSLMLIL